MKALFETKFPYLTLKKPIFQNFNDMRRINSINSNEDDTTEDKKAEKEFSFHNVYIMNKSWEKINNDISSKINIIISKDDIMQEHKLLNSKTNLNLSKNQSPKKDIFLCIKRLHDEEDQTQGEICPISENSDKSEKIKKNGNKIDKKAAYKKHDKMEKDNIVRKIQVHYCNFLINLMNEIIKKIIIDESYKTENAEEIIHMKDYLFNNIDYKFKSNIKKAFMEKSENMKIKEIISPSKEFRELYGITKNKNEEIMKKIELKNNPILNKILNQKYLHYFNEIYYQNKKNLDFNEENENINVVLSNNIKMFNDLVSKNMDDKNYISKLKRVAMQNFSKPKYMFKIKK